MAWSCSSARNKAVAPQCGTSLLEVLAAAVIIFIVLAAAIVIYFASLMQTVREIVDSEASALSRSIEHSIRAGVRANLAPDKRSFFADVEGVRVFVPLPQPGQPAVELPDYDEGATGIDWDQSGAIDHFPGFAKPETSADVNPKNGIPDNQDGIDQDGDGLADDLPGTPRAISEELQAIGVGGISQAYDGFDNDGDTVNDDLALWLYPVGLLAQIDTGSFREVTIPPPGPTPPALPGIPQDGTGNWIFQGSLGLETVVLSPVDEDLNGDGFVTAPAAGTIPPILGVEAALDLNPILLNSAHGRYYPDTFEDRDGNGQVTRFPGGTNIDTPGGGPHNPDFYEFSEDFNLNGFLDVPTRATFSGESFFHLSYGGVAPTPALPADPLTNGFPGTFPPPAAVQTPYPYQTANFVYAAQYQPARSYGYSLLVQRVEESGGSTQGYGGVARGVYRITLSIYSDYPETIRRFRNAERPDPLRVQIFEVIVE